MIATVLVLVTTIGIIYWVRNGTFSLVWQAINGTVGISS